MGSSRHLLSVFEIECGDRVCMTPSRDLCPYFANMGKTFGKCLRFDVLLRVRAVLKGMPVAQRCRGCLDSEDKFRKLREIHKACDMIGRDEKGAI